MKGPPAWSPPGMLSNSSWQNFRVIFGVTVARSSRLKLLRARIGGFSGKGCVGHALSPGSASSTGTLRSSTP